MHIKAKVQDICWFNITFYLHGGHEDLREVARLSDKDDPFKRILGNNDEMLRRIRELDQELEGLELVAEGSGAPKKEEEEKKQVSNVVKTEFMEFDEEDANLLLKKFLQLNMVKDVPDVGKEDIAPNHQSIAETFNCSICTRIVVEPQECPQCQTAFCGACLGDWLQKN